jgi:hypothetical protein
MPTKFTCSMYIRVFENCFFCDGLRLHWHMLNYCLSLKNRRAHVPVPTRYRECHNRHISPHRAARRYHPPSWPIAPLAAIRCMHAVRVRAHARARGHGVKILSESRKHGFLDPWVNISAESCDQRTYDTALKTQDAQLPKKMFFYART